MGVTLITGLRKVALGLLSILLIVLLAGASYQFFSNRRDLRLHPPPGQMIDIGGYRLHLYCSGPGLPLSSSIPAYRTTPSPGTKFSQR
jgi:hypothetical protein